MSVIALFSDLSAHLRSPEFLQAARHPLHPMAFTRSRKLPLPALVALLLTGMRKSVQATRVRQLINPNRHKAQ